MKEKARLQNIPFFDKIAYGSGNLGYGIVFQSLNAYIVFYATAIINIPGSLVGLAIALSVIWDGLTDPLMGYLSDKTDFTILGRRHLYILIGTIASSFCNYYLWIINPDYSLIIKFFWLVLTVISVKTFLTVFITPHAALGAELSHDYNERTSIQAIRTVFFLLGLFLASTVGMFLFFKPTPEFAIGQLNPTAYRNIGLATSVLMLFLGLFCFFTTLKYIPYLHKLKEKNRNRKKLKQIFIDLLLILKNQDYRYVICAYLFANIASALIGTIGLHVFTFTFQMNNRAIALIIGSQFMISILSQPLWWLIAKKTDKKPAAKLASIISIIGSGYLLIAVFLRNIIIINYYYLLPFSIIVGMGTGGLFTLPLSMIADIIDVEELKTKERQEGVYYGCLTFAYKISQSIAIFVLGILLDIIGFDASLEIQPVNTVFLLGFVLAFGGIISFLLAFFAYNKYHLKEKSIKNIQKKLIET